MQIQFWHSAEPGALPKMPREYLGQPLLTSLLNTLWSYLRRAAAGVGASCLPPKVPQEGHKLFAAERASFIMGLVSQVPKVPQMVLRRGSQGVIKVE